MPKPLYPTLITWTDPTGKIHIPPDPPLIDGYPPWYPRPNEYRRDEPLRRCPALTCRRARRCESMLYGAYCRKTHMEKEEFRAKLLAKIEAFMVERNIPQTPAHLATNDPPPPEMKRHLERRLAECIEQELLAFQTKWIEKQKQRFAAKPHSHALNPTEKHQRITTR